MKTDLELQQEQDNLYLSLDCADTFPRIAALKVCGNPCQDLNIFTLYESGGKSYDAKDPGNLFKPPVPDANGLYCGTVNDVTWPTWLQYFPNSPASRFYNMSNDDRLVIITDVFRQSNFSKSTIINCFLAYCIWASGSCNSEVELYHDWYQCDLAADITVFPIILNRLVDIRLFVLSQFTDANLYYTGWSCGVLLLRKLLRQYIQIPLK